MEYNSLQVCKVCMPIITSSCSCTFSAQ